MIADPCFARLKRLIIGETGLNYYEERESDLAARVSRRIAEVGAGSIAEYMDLLESRPDGEQEMDLLVAELTIGETYFFRQNEHFRVLQNVVFPELLERKRASRRLNIWSAGCATGAEPYSLALLLQRELGDRVDGWDISITGTDINREFLRQAQAGRFRDWAFRECPEDVKNQCFVREGNEWALRPEYKSWVSFQYHNLVARPLPSPANNLFAFDLILCRNVMIYFSADVFQSTVDRLYECLSDGGWLLVGHAEPNQEIFRRFWTVMSDGVTLYRRHVASAPPPRAVIEAAPAAPAPSPPADRETAQPALQTAGAGGRARRKAIDIDSMRALADRGLWEAAAAACRALLERDGLDPALHYYHALILEHTGALPGAEKELKNAVYLDRRFVLGHYHLALARLRKGEVAKARKSFENALVALADRADSEEVEHGDGMTVAEFRELTRMQIEALPA